MDTIKPKSIKLGSVISILLLITWLLCFWSCEKYDQVNSAEEAFIVVKGGLFQMGSSKDNSRASLSHLVKVSDFKIGKYEVTNAQYCVFLNAKGNRAGAGGTWIYLEKSKIEQRDNQYIPLSGYENHPVVSVSWEGAYRFAEWKGARLPTEAEWEFAARGGNLTKGYTYSGSNQIEAVAWYEKNSGNKTHAVGLKKPNELGIFDMSGNVWEWCNDWFHASFDSGSDKENPQRPDTGTAKVLRGGELQFDEKFCRVDNRYSISPHARNTRIGFRLVKGI